ncbi:aldo/keto reductase family domain-containing protein [Ditylenchus destructor]|nr:aldo/keto reductase family domain-containing protein [Ditylenchus destructor]
MTSKFGRKVPGGTFRLLDGNEMPMIGLGTYDLRDQGEVDFAVNAALEHGYRLFDTANYYRNETQLGNAFKKVLPNHNLTRENIFITTKANIRSGEVERNARAMIDNSLRCLQTSYIDLVLIHYPKDWGVADNNPSNSQDRQRMYKVLEDYKDSGKVRSIGVSNYETRHIEEIWNTSRHRPTVNQCEFHPHLTRRDLVDYCKTKGIFFQAHTSLAKQSRSLYEDRTVNEIAGKHDVTIPQLLLAFAHFQGIGVIPKSADEERIILNLKLLHAPLTGPEIQRLNVLNCNKAYSDCAGWSVS